MLFMLFLACEEPTKVHESTPVTVDCSARPLEVPITRGEMSGGWDDVQKRFIFFGGDEGVPENCQSQTSFSGETWAFQTDCGNFVQLSPATAPAARGRYAMATDAARNQLLLHGGRTREGTSGTYTVFDDLWAFDMATDTWTQLAEGGPPARSNHTMVVAGDRLILFGGNDSDDGLTFGPLSDLWAYDLNAGTWSELRYSGDDPGARLFHSATVSDDGATLYVYGGGDENAFFGPFFKDLYALDLNSLVWTRLDSGRSNAPDGRIWATLNYDAPRGRLLLFGGHDDGSLGNTNQLWAYDLNALAWSEVQAGDIQTGDASGFCDFPADFVTPDLNLPERRNAHAADLSPDGQLYIFGGKTDCGSVNDLWSLDVASATWTEHSAATSGEACVRASLECESLCF